MKWFPFVISAALAAAAEPTLSASFEGGSLGKVVRVSANHFRVDAKGETDRNGRNRQANWYYFRVDGAGREPLLIDIVNLPGEYNFQPNRGAITRDTPPVLSYDRKSWSHVETFDYDETEPRLRLRLQPRRSTFWVAHTPPYTGEHLDRLRRLLPRGSEALIGRTVGGRPLYLWTLGSGPRVVWLMFRQHAWESGTSWVAEGAVRELLSRGSLRRAATWKILPLCDPDGVARGGVRFNANGYDLNRNWDAIDPAQMPEIAAQHAAVERWVRGGGRVDVFLSLHNTETSEYLEGPPDPSYKDRAGRLFEALSEQTSFAPSRPLFFAAPAAARGRMTVVEGLSRDFGIPVFLMEQRVGFHPRLGRLPGIADRLRFGRELVHVLAAAVR